MGKRDGRGYGFFEHQFDFATSSKLTELYFVILFRRFRRTRIDVTFDKSVVIWKIFIFMKNNVFRFHFFGFSDRIFRYNKALAVPAEQNQVFRKWFDRNDSIDSNFIERINTQMFVPLLMSLLIVSLAEALLGSRLNCSGFESNFPKSFVKVFFSFFFSFSLCRDVPTLEP